MRFCPHRAAEASRGTSSHPCQRIRVFEWECKSRNTHFDLSSAVSSYTKPRTCVLCVCGWLSSERTRTRCEGSNRPHTDTHNEQPRCGWPGVELWRVNVVRMSKKGAWLEKNCVSQAPDLSVREIAVIFCSVQFSTVDCCFEVARLQATKHEQ